MTRKQIPTWGFLIAAPGFGAAAVIRVLTGGALTQLSLYWLSVSPHSS